MDQTLQWHKICFRQQWRETWHALMKTIHGDANFSIMHFIPTKEHDNCRWRLVVDFLFFEVPVSSWHRDEAESKAAAEVLAGEIRADEARRAFLEILAGTTPTTTTTPHP